MAALNDFVFTTLTIFSKVSDNKVSSLGSMPCAKAIDPENNNIVFIIHYDTHRVQMSIPINTLHNIKKSDYDIVNVIKQIFDTAEIEKADREKYVEILNLLKL